MTNSKIFLMTKNISLEIFSYYLDYFHDGSMRNIICLDDEIIFEVESAQIYTCDNRDNLPLSRDNTIYGRLHAKGIVYIKKNDNFVQSLKMEYDCVNLVGFEIVGKFISLCGNWVKYGTKIPRENEWFGCEVFASEIYWENTANTTDPAFLGKYMGLKGSPSYAYPRWYIDKYGPPQDEEKSAFDREKPEKTKGHARYDHYHRTNPKATGAHDEYLDNKGKPCRRGTDNFHLYSQNKEKWDY